MTLHDRAWLDIDRSALRHNLAVLRAKAGVALMPIIKANAYGLGAVEVARTLGVPFGDEAGQDGRIGFESTGAGSNLGTEEPPNDLMNTPRPWGVGISSLDEAEVLRRAGCSGRVFCATPILPNEFQRAVELRVRPALHRSEDIELWWSLSNGRAPYHLSVDTGMSRAGERWDRVADLLPSVSKAPPEGVFTHFHSVDESAESRDEQDRRFSLALSTLRAALPEKVLIHSDNSGAIASRGNGCPGSLARPGIALYAGLYSSALGLRQVAHVRARVVDVREVLPWESVSYGATWIAPPGALRKVATIAAGYADGYRWKFSNVGHVLLHGTICPVVGRVTMDMTMVDVTEIPCTPGDVATLLGSDGHETLTVESITGRAEVFPYEFLVGLGLRLPPFYHDILPSTTSASK